MRIEVQKTQASHRSRIVRDDGVTLELRSPDRKFAPPHDVIHFVVEQSLALHRGFWGTVADGGVFPSMKVTEGRQAPHAAARSKELIKANQSSLREAEVLVGVFQEALLRGQKLCRQTIEIRAKEQGQAIESNDIRAVWSSLVAVRKRWIALPKGQCLVLHWPDIQKPKPNRAR